MRLVVFLFVLSLRAEDPDAFGARLREVELLRNAGRWGEAERLLMQPGLELGLEERARRDWVLGAIRADLGELELARVQFRRVLSNPGATAEAVVMAHVRILHLWVWQGDVASAAVHLQRLGEVEGMGGASPQARGLLLGWMAYVAASQQRNQQAAAWLDAARRLLTEGERQSGWLAAEGWVVLAHGLCQLKQYPEAEAATQRALALVEAEHGSESVVLFPYWITVADIAFRRGDDRTERRAAEEAWKLAAALPDRGTSLEQAACDTMRRAYRGRAGKARWQEVKASCAWREPVRGRLTVEAALPAGKQNRLQ